MNAEHERAILNSVAAAIVGGIVLTWVARRLRIPTILPLLLGGISLGPVGLGLVQPSSIESVLPVVVSLSIGIILFEGGLTLDLRGYATGSRAITRLLTIGAMVTWLGTAACAWLVLGLDPSMALLAGSLVIVTGPTVIGPILEGARLTPRIHHVLHWEGVLIDPIGVFVALLCFEWVAGRGAEAAVLEFGLRTITGVAIGVVGGLGIVAAYQRQLVPESLLNVVALGLAVLVFAVAEAVVSEAGLLSATVAGLLVAWRRPLELKQIRQFKAEITHLLIGLLFILLTSRLRIEQFVEFGAGGMAVIALVILVVRPLNVLLSTLGSRLSWRERAFLALVAPRGIVAASMASLFALELSARNAPEAEIRPVETLTYSMIVVTVVVQGFGARWIGRALGLSQPEPSGWLVVGANALSRGIAAFIRDAGHDVLLMDTNARRVSEARAEGLDAVREDALDLDLAGSYVQSRAVGHLLAMTDNAELNALVCSHWSGRFGRKAAYRWGCRRLDAAAGQTVFEDLARPAVISAELESGASRLVVVDPASGAPLPDARPLAARRGTSIHLVRTARPDCLAGDQWLFLQRSRGYLARALERGDVIDASADTLESLYRNLVDRVVELEPDVPRDQTLRDMLDPAEMLPAFLGHGIAIPHIQSRHVADRICILARLRRGLPVPGQDDPLRLVFFVLSPSGDPEGHLATLAEIARICSESATRENLHRASDLRDVARALVREM